MFPAIVVVVFIFYKIWSFELLIYCSNALQIQETHNRNLKHNSFELRRISNLANVGNCGFQHFEIAFSDSCIFESLPKSGFGIFEFETYSAT